MPSDVTGMSSDAVLAVGAVVLVGALELRSERVQDLECRDVDVERVRLAVAVGHDLGAEALTDPAAVLRVRDVGEDAVADLVSTLDSVTNGTPFCSACSSCLATLARLTALRITASAPWRSAVWNAFWSCSGEPSVPIVLAVQPRSAAPCLMMSPWISQASTPQLMKATFLPVGTGLPIGFSGPMLFGRVIAFSASACASARPAPPPASGRAAVRLAAAAQPATTIATTPRRRARTSAASACASSLDWIDIRFSSWCRLDVVELRRSGGGAGAGRAPLDAGQRERGDQDDADEHVARPTAARWPARDR